MSNAVQPESFKNRAGQILRFVSLSTLALYVLKFLLDLMVFLGYINLYSLGGIILPSFILILVSNKKFLPAILVAATATAFATLSLLGLAGEGRLGFLYFIPGWPIRLALEIVALAALVGCIVFLVLALPRLKRT
jgi:hypothetical protein